MASSPVYEYRAHTSTDLITYPMSVDSPTVDYHYSYSYRYPWVNRTVNHDLFVDLGEQEWMAVAEGILSVRVSGRKHLFRLEDVSRVSFSLKYLILPMIVGGIVAPFGLIALISQYLDFWVAAILFFTGIILIYLGFRGSWQVSIEQHGSSFQFFTDEQNTALRESIDQLNQMVGKKNRKIFW